MRQSVLGFNQAKAVENELDMTDLILLNYIMYANGNPAMKHIVKDDVSYVWLSHEKIHEDLPILGIAESTLKNRISELKKKGFIMSKVVASTQGRGSTSYYSVTELTTSLQNDVKTENDETRSCEKYLVARPSTSKSTSNNKLFTDNKLGDIITINSNNTENRTTTDDVDDVSDFESHGYSKEDLKSDFLGSIKKKQPKKRVSLYDKCVDEIYCYTKNINLQDTLVQYLSIRLAMKDKPIYGVNQFKGMLSRLTELSDESDSDKRSDKRIKIVQQSIEKGWASFYEYKENKQNYNSKYQQNEDVFSEFGQVSCDKIEEEICDEEF